VCVCALWRVGGGGGERSVGRRSQGLVSGGSGRRGGCRRAAGARAARAPPRRPPAHRSGCFRGLCRPDLGTARRLSTNGRSSASPWVSGTSVKGSPLRGSGMARLAVASTQRPPTARGGGGGGRGRGSWMPRRAAGHGRTALLPRPPPRRCRRASPVAPTQVLRLGGVRARPLVDVDRRPAGEAAGGGAAAEAARAAAARRPAQRAPGAQRGDRAERERAPAAAAAQLLRRDRRQHGCGLPGVRRAGCDAGRARGAAHVPRRASVSWRAPRDRRCGRGMWAAGGWRLNARLGTRRMRPGGGRRVLSAGKAPGGRRTGPGRLDAGLPPMGACAAIRVDNMSS
jgi:hypothetical protein